MNQRNNKMLEVILKSIDEKHGKDLRVIDLEKVSTIADYFVITHGDSARQTKVIADEIVKELEEQELFIYNKEGYQMGNWILLDYGDIVVHIFDKDTREFYNLEKIWQDARIIDVNNQ